MSPISFSFSSVFTIHDQVRLQPSREAGGLLAGYGHNVLKAFPAANDAPDPASEFAIDAPQMARLLEAIDGAGGGLDLLGSYHSHPNGRTDMSPADVATARGTGLLLIVAPREPTWEWALWDPSSGGQVQPLIAWPNAFPRQG